MRDRIKKILKEENDFDWTGDVNPVSKEDIISTLHSLSDVGYRRALETSQLTEAIYNLALNENQLDSLAKALYHLADYSHNEGIDIGHQQGYSEGERDGYQYGYSEGHDEGYDEGKQEIDDELELEREKGYDEGYGEGLSDGYTKGYEEGVEVTYHKAFEEGRAYEAGIEVEDFERRESGFDPNEYYDEEEENY